MAKSRHGFTFMSGYKPPAYKLRLPRADYPGEPSQQTAYFAWLKAKYGSDEAATKRLQLHDTRPQGIIAMRTFATEAQAIAAVNAIMAL